MSGADREYASLALSFCARTLYGVLVDTPELSAPVWLPRSAVHFTGQKLINGADRGDVIELRVEERVAREKGLI